MEYQCYDDGKQVLQRQKPEERTKNLSSFIRFSQPRHIGQAILRQGYHRDFDFLSQELRVSWLWGEHDCAPATWNGA